LFGKTPVDLTVPAAAWGTELAYETNLLQQAEVAMETLLADPQITGQLSLTAGNNVVPRAVTSLRH